MFLVSFANGKKNAKKYRHGRDHKLRVWTIKSSDEDHMEKRLPVDRDGDGEEKEETSASSRSATTNQPWLLHSLPVNALNFCAFSLCFLAQRFMQHDATRSTSDRPGPLPGTVKDSSPASVIPNSRQLLFAVPNALNSGAIDIFHLPSEKRITTIPADSLVQTGMVMAVGIFLDVTDKNEMLLYAVSAYEDGHAMVHRCEIGSYFYEFEPTSSVSTLQWRKLYSNRAHSQPILSLDVLCLQQGEGERKPAFFLTSSADAMIVKHPIPRSPTSETTPLKAVNTKHAGQQGIRIRTDGKLFATAGWDARIRVYSLKSMRELAVLKWHKEGCYCIAFAKILNSETSLPSNEDPPPEDYAIVQSTQERVIPEASAPLKGGSLAELQRKREIKTKATHWLAAGSKDGKVSLWDIY